MIKVLSVNNVPLYLHWSLILLLLLGFMPNANIVLPYIFISLIFVVFHEYGHILIAQYLNLPVKDVTLYAFGGVAKVIFDYSSPKKEILVALAGPLVNLILMILFILLLLISFYLNLATLILFSFFLCILSNFIIFAFNLFVCILPMDGGRVLRAFLSFKIGHERATWWTVRIGQIGGFTLATISFYYGFFVAGVFFIIMCVFSQNELSHAKLLASLYRIRIHLAWRLNKPELREASLPELILALESVEDEALKQKIQTELLPLLKDLNQSSIGV